MTNFRLGLLLLFAAVSNANLSRNLLQRKLSARNEPLSARAEEPPPIVIYNFDQITNHFPNDTFYGPPPINATFVQRYVVNDTFYKPGGPVIMFDSGEGPAPNLNRYLQTGIGAELAQAIGAIVLILEHRYYGTSIPTEDLSTDNLRWLTTDQDLADIAYFAQHVSIPGHEDEDLTAPGRPWILYGGSLPGAEVAFMMKQYPNIIYGAISSSGTVQAWKGYPQWYYPVQQHGPQDCIKSIEDIVDQIDFLVATKNKKAITELKTIFGLQDLQDIRDFALTIAFPIGNPMFYPVSGWQELNWDPNRGSPNFFYFCGNVTSTNTTFSAVDSQLSKYTGGKKWKNLGNYANYIKENIIPLCPEGVSLDSFQCFGTHNASAWDNPLDFSGNRAYVYQSCLEAGQWSQAAPPGRRSLLSRVVQEDYTEDWCQWSFPKGKHNAIPPSPILQRWNKYGGLKLQADRLAQIDGGIDPWLYACVHSPDGFPRKDTLLRPYYLIEQGGHHWDSNGLGNISLEPDYIQKIHNYEIKFVKSWLADFPKWKPGHHN